jgi:hypothetical protein
LGAEFLIESRKQVCGTFQDYPVRYGNQCGNSANGHAFRKELDSKTATMPEYVGGIIFIHDDLWRL